MLNKCRSDLDYLAQLWQSNMDKAVEVFNRRFDYVYQEEPEYEDMWVEMNAPLA